jgi:hypothetical protein
MELFSTFWWEGKKDMVTLEITWQILKKLKLPEVPDTPLLVIYSGEMKIYAYIKTCAQMFLAALFISQNVETIQMSIN